MKNSILSLLILLFTATSHKPKETFKDTIFYVTDPNGIFLFSDPRNIRNRIAVPYKTKLVSLGAEKFSISSKNKEEEEKYFEKLLYKEKIYYVEESNADKFIKLEPPNSDLYTYTQVPQATIYSLPFKDSKVVKRLPEFTWLEVVAKGERYMGEPSNEVLGWLEVEFANIGNGFMLEGEVLMPNSLQVIKQALKNRVIDKTGIFQVTVDKPNFFEDINNIEIAKPIESEYRDYLPKKGAYAKIIRSLEKNKTRHYLIERLDLKHAREMDARGIKELNDSEVYFWISEKQGMFFSDTEFEKHTFKNSKYKKDLILYNLFRWKYGGGVNFETMQVSKYISKNNSEFYLIEFYYGVSEKPYYAIVERAGNKYKEIFIATNVMEAVGVQIFTKIIGDLDGDGFPEFIGMQVGRSGSGQELHSFQNGKMKFIIGFPLRSTIEFNKEYITASEEKFTNCVNGKCDKEIEITRYKFLKGKLYKEAAKDKWEDVKSESGD